MSTPGTCRVFRLVFVVVCVLVAVDHLFIGDCLLP